MKLYGVEKCDKFFGPPFKRRERVLPSRNRNLDFKIRGDVHADNNLWQMPQRPSLIYCTHISYRSKYFTVL